jgi:hypothetical protein
MQECSILAIASVLLLGVWNDRRVLSAYRKTSRSEFICIIKNFSKSVLYTPRRGAGRRNYRVPTPGRSTVNQESFGVVINFGMR